jgi:hypothetical protein
MVEFPLVGPAERKGFAAPVRNYPRYRGSLTLTLRHQAGVWLRLVCGKLTHSPQASMRG